MFNLQFFVVVILLTIAHCYEADLGIPVKTTKWKTNLYSNKTKEKVFLPIKFIKNFTLVIPKKCEELGICEHVPNYPQQLVWRIIMKLLRQNITFNRDVEQWADYTNFLEKASSTHDLYEYEDLCKSKAKVYFPQAARDVSNRWSLILNSAETPQNFIGEQCEPNYPVCSKIAHFSKAFYHGACVQKFAKRVMYGLNSEFNGVIKTLFEVPSCCACVARRTS